MDNRTDFEAHPQVLLDVDGEKLVTVVKASFELPRGSNELVIAPEERNRPVRPADIPWGEPDVSSIGYPSDLCLRKPGSDVIVVGKGYAPGGEPVPSFDVHVTVGHMNKALRLFGPRVFTGTGLGMTKPSPIAELELRYENAWGGFDDEDPDNVVEEPRNPIGRGKVADSAARAGQPAPQIEDPYHLLSNLDTEPAPAGVGAIGRHWMPRRKYAGSYDEIWQQTRAPLPPIDLDDRHHLCATPDLSTDKLLKSGETVKLYNLLPGGGGVEFALPVVHLEIAFDVKGRERAIFAPHLDTVILDLLETSDEKPPAVEMVWRASVRAPRRLRDARVIVREKDSA
ncbi:MAG: DUF2169 domain-containing protein [Polyangiaceae bacterium]